MNNTIHQYYKRTFEDQIILVQVDPENFKGLELIIEPGKKVKKTKRFFDSEIFEDLKEDQFEKSSPLEFNLYLKGLVP